MFFVKFIYYNSGHHLFTGIIRDHPFCLEANEKAKMKLFSTVLPYLLLVSFYSGQINNFGIDKIKAINESPYNGVAVPLIGAYDTGKYDEKDFEPAVKLIKKESKKHTWPWVFFNRFIGYKEGERSLSPMAKTKYFQSIKGMDIYNESGALKDFENIWRMSLKIAKELRSPGIVIDPEAYNNYRNYQLSYLARQIHKPEEEIKKRLKEVGAELVEIAEKEYPEATLWFLFTGLGSPQYRTVTYIIQGMLERAKEKGSKLKFVSGGELMGYCYDSLDDLKETIKRRNESFSDIIATYPNLYLGGTIAPWNDVKLKKGNFTKGKCGRSKLKTMEDFKPLIGQLLKSYGYVWIYAAKMVRYNPYSPDVSSTYNKTIGELISGSRWSNSNY